MGRKKKIKLNERQLRKVIKESVYRILNEWDEEELSKPYHKMYGQREDGNFKEIGRELQTLGQYMNDIFDDSQNNEVIRELDYALSPVWGLIQNRNNYMNDDHAFSMEEVSNLRGPLEKAQDILNGLKFNRILKYDSKYSILSRTIDRLLHLI